MGAPDPESDATIARMWREGASLTDIGEALGRDRKSIASRISRLRKRGLYDLGFRRANDSRTRDREDTEALRKLRAEGNTPAQIAKKLNRTQKWAASRCFTYDREMREKAAVRPPVPPPKRQMRKCLCCSRRFSSEWNGERVCRECKTTSAYTGSIMSVYA